MDRAQLRLALLLAAPANRIFLVGDDDQSHLRLATRRRPPRARSRRRPAGPATRRPGGQPPLSAAGRRARRPARRAQPRAVREADQGRARRDGQPRACAGWRRRDGPPRARAANPGRTTDRRGRSWRGRTASCCRPSPWPSSCGWPFRAPRIELPVESPLVDEALEQLAARRTGREPLLVMLGRLRTERARRRPRGDLSEVLRHLLAWAARYPDLDGLRRRCRARRARASPRSAATTRP